MTFTQDCTSLECMPLFRGVEPSRLKIVAMTSERLDLRDGEALILRGVRPSHVFLVLDGHATVIDESGHAPMPMTRLGWGDIAGDTAVLTGTAPTCSSVRADGPMTVLRIEQNAFLELLQQFPALSMALLRSLAHRLELACAPGRVAVDPGAMAASRAGTRAHPGAYIDPEERP